MWAVWLGRHPVENISIGHKDELTEVGNLGLSAWAKAHLTVFRTARNSGTKVGPSEPSRTFNRFRM